MVNPREIAGNLEEEWEMVNPRNISVNLHEEGEW